MHTIQTVSIYNDIEILGHVFHGLADIQARVEKSKLNSYSINSYPELISFPHVGLVHESYPCFDSYDSMYENRTYQNYIFRAEPITDEDINALYQLKPSSNAQRLHDSTPPSFFPMLYYKGDGPSMQIATE